MSIINNYKITAKFYLSLFLFFSTLELKFIKIGINRLFKILLQSKRSWVFKKDGLEISHPLFFKYLYFYSTWKWIKHIITQKLDKDQRDSFVDLIIWTLIKLFKLLKIFSKSKKRNSNVLENMSQIHF